MDNIEAIPLVQVKPLQALLADYSFSRPATALSLNDTTLSSELTAQVEQASVNVGDLAHEGEVLITLNCRDEKNRLQQVRAQLSAAQAGVNSANLSSVAQKPCTRKR
ncbi:MAG: biotin/lipoyl-binding protein [Limnobacter sp.]|nr:biotin/lipoyl-binding protein [Limnobacter sp.]